MLEAFQYHSDIINNPFKVSTIGMIIVSSSILLNVLPEIKLKLLLMAYKLSNPITQEQMDFILDYKVNSRSARDYGLIGRDILQILRESSLDVNRAMWRIYHKSVNDLPSANLNDIKGMNDHAERLYNEVGKYQAYTNISYMDYPKEFFPHFKVIVDHLFGIRKVMNELVHTSMYNVELNSVGLLPYYEKELNRLNEITQANFTMYVETIFHNANWISGIIT
uniref:Uncharacterized protein ORF2 n=1 Tax=Sporothrix schenckii TaxID=29908 RepID=F8WKZ6_SPOSC|nr:hypothetical protein SpscM_p09 [Sporothrix schenckii]BAK55706.1 hypothetical protein [Sporothrix schenckii]